MSRRPHSHNPVTGNREGKQGLKCQVFQSIVEICCDESCLDWAIESGQWAVLTVIGPFTAPGPHHRHRLQGFLHRLARHNEGTARASLEIIREELKTS